MVYLGFKNKCCHYVIIFFQEQLKFSRAEQLKQTKHVYLLFKHLEKQIII